MSRRVALALGAACLVAGLAGCGPDGAGGDGDGGADGGSDPTSASPSIDAALLECGETPAAEETWRLQDVDLTAVEWSMPPGFVETFAYSEDRPLEHIETFWVAEPATDPVVRNVLTVVVYSGLEWGSTVDACGRLPQSVVDDRMTGYQDTHGAVPLTEPEPTEVAGLPALRQDLSYDEYDYRGYWVFGRSQLVHVYCQWTDEEQQARVLAGCDDLVASVEVPGG